MATGLGDKLHLALEQVKKKKKTTWEFSFPGNPSVWILPRSTALLVLVPHRSVWFCLYHPLQKRVKIQGWGSWMCSPLPQSCFHFPTTPESPERAHVPPFTPFTLMFQHFPQAAHQSLPPPTVQGNDSSLFPFFFVFPESRAHQKGPWNCSLSSCAEGSCPAWAGRSWAWPRNDLWEGRLRLTDNQLSENRELHQNLGSLKLQDNMQRYSSFLISPPCSVTQTKRYQTQCPCRSFEHCHFSYLILTLVLKICSPPQESYPAM